MAESSFVFALYDGFIVAETDDAVGFSSESDGDVEFWIPKSHLRCVTYHDGDDTEFYLEEEIEAIQIPMWLAQDRGLEYE